METWSLTFSDWDLKEEKLRETLMTLGNGFYATRGAAEESQSGAFHYPGTYLGGGYNQLATKIDDKNIEHEDLVNCPNWLCLSFRYPGGEWFDLSKVKIISYYQKLDMKKGELIRFVHFIDIHDRETKLHTSRFVSMDNQHLGCIQWELEAVNWTSEIEIKSSIDGGVLNEGVKRYEGLGSKHLEILNKSTDPLRGIFILLTKTSQSELLLSQAVRTEVFENDIKIDKGLLAFDNGEEFGFTLNINLEPTKKVKVEKIMSFFTSRDRACSNPSYEATHMVRSASSYSNLLLKHVRQWERLWGLCDMELKGKVRETRLLRLHIFHLLQTVSLKSIDLDLGVPARGLHGEAYRGHIFWDEIFILPFLNFRIPELSRSLLMYRYRRLDKARENAKEYGLHGAMYPWQSASNGEEESQVFHRNPNSGRWINDLTQRQRHINAAIVYNIWQYYQTTDDREFISQFGAEIALEICRFWISCLKYNFQKKKYEILNVVGPDEFHTEINNNAYTNYMASWCLKITIEMFLTLAEDRQNELLGSLDLSRNDLSLWHDVSRNIFLPIREDGVIEQFEGFDHLKNLDFELYRKKYGNIRRIDRILESEGDDVNKYKVNKQPDVLMLYYLFTSQELKSGFQWLSYQFQESSIPKNIEYYISLSTNGSTLSGIVHAWILSRYAPDKSWVLFSRALETDVADLQGGTTSEGIHLGAMAGTVDLVQRCFTGIEVRQDVLWINPKFPNEIEMNLLLHFRGHSLEMRFEKDVLHIKVKSSFIQTGKLGINQEIYSFNQGDEFQININQRNQKVAI